MFKVGERVRVLVWVRMRVRVRERGEGGGVSSLLLVGFNTWYFFSF